MSRPSLALALSLILSCTGLSAQTWQETSLKDIRPAGWLEQKFISQKEGLTGHPEALSYPYDTDLWDGEIPRMGTHGQDWWRYEQTAYYTDGLLRLGYLLNDKALIDKGEAGISYTLSHPWENGRLGSKVISNTWPFAVFFRAVKAAYDETPDPAVLAALSGHYHSIPLSQLVRKRDIISLEGMLWTAARTGDKALVARADSAFRYRGKLLKGVDIKRDDRVTPEFLMAETPYNMHGVTMSEFLKLPILLYAATGNPWYRQLAVSSLDRLYAEDGLPDGLFTSAEWLQGRGIRHSHETCNAIDMSWTLGYFLEILQDARYADMLEKIVFNAGAGSVTQDFKALQYYSSVNQFLATGTSNHNKDNYCSTWMAYRPTHQTECCAGNIHRLYPNYAARMWLRGEGEAVAALYGPSEFLYSEQLSFVEETEYPYGETVVFRAKAAKGAHAAKLTLRIPGWCRNAGLRVNGKEWKGLLESGSFVTLDRRWKDGDRIELQLPMSVESRTAFGGGIYFQRGPLVYSFAIPATYTKDTLRYANMNGKYPADDEAFPCWDIQPSGPWNYAVKADVQASPLPGPALRIPVYPISWTFDRGPQGELLTPDLPVAPVPEGPEQYIELVPYGSTTLRLTVFPVIDSRPRPLALDIFSRNPELSAGNLCGYFPQDTLVSEAPKGYRPFYISHIGRHGSRFIGDKAMKYFYVIDTLAFYAGKGMLSAEGIALMEDVRTMLHLTQGREGALTELGALEHRQICSRMVRHYPEVFSDPKRVQVQAFSTGVPRVMDSMDAFLAELSERAPGLSVETAVAAGSKDPVRREVAGYLASDSQNEELDAKEEELKKLGKEIIKDRNDFSVFGARIFLDPEKVSRKTVYYIARSSYKTLKTGRVTDPEHLPSMGKYYTADELYALWVNNGISWLRNINMPGFISPQVTTRGYGILDRIIADADEAIRKGSTTAATLRFSHDTALLPLMGAIPLEGAVLKCDEMDLLEHFQDFNFICPACNVQLIFYRNKGGEVLVKFLRNEKETLIDGLAPKTGCYYDWNSVKKFWAAR
jgi:hypothetical protein